MVPVANTSEQMHLDELQGAKRKRVEREPSTRYFIPPSNAAAFETSELRKAAEVYQPVPHRTSPHLTAPHLLTPSPPHHPLTAATRPPPLPSPPRHSHQTLSHLPVPRQPLLTMLNEVLGTETVGGSVLVSKDPSPQAERSDAKKPLRDEMHTLKQKRQGYHYDWNQDTLENVAGSEGVTVVISIDAGGKLLFADQTCSQTRFVGGQHLQVLKAAAERRVRIPEYGACLFRGIMWHAGDSYEGEHWRMHFYLLRSQGRAAADFRDTPGNRDLGLHAVEGVDEYLSGLQRPSCADFDATVFSVLTVGRELKERKWGQHK